MAIELRSMRYASRLADTGNFSRAAESIGITQSALSRSVAALEGEIGFAIFDRTGAGVVPTVLGRQFLAEARKVLHSAQQLDVEAKAWAAGDGGVLNFGIGPLLASLLLPELLVTLTTRSPRLKVVPTIGTAVELMSALADRKIEMCLLAEGSTSIHGMTASPVGAVTVAMVARAGHPLAARRSLRLQELAGFPLATGSYEGRTLDGTEPEPSIVCENFHILREIVLASDTIWLSSASLSKAHGDERLVELDVTDYPPTRHTIILGRMENSTPSRAGRQAEVAISALLQQRFSDAEAGR